MSCLWFAACGSPVPPAAKKIEWVSAPSGAVAPLVKREEARAQRDGRRVLVYVGATWCEPCRRFHDAVKSGQLDEQFGQLRFIEFDLDRDNERLAEAGYLPKMIPLFAVPDAEGLATPHQMEGSIKGSGAVAQMAPRLHALLAN
jgi:thiol-disulfide isomerase/thioredoxin